MKFSLVLLTLIAANGFVMAETPSSLLTAQPSAVTTEWTVQYRGQKILAYSFAPGQAKPYVKELAPLGGENILRDSPSDHRHHHALMYGIVVNGVNFWEETPGNGIQKVTETSSPKMSVSAQGLPQSVIHQTLHWVTPTNAFLPETASEALLIEERTLTVTVDETNREVALQWESVFEVGKNPGKIELDGATYHGLGMRFQKSLDPLAKHFFEGGEPDLRESRQDVSPHAWEAVAFDVSSHPSTIALFGLPSNPAGEATYFSMKTPFAYLSATQNLSHKKITYTSGEKFTLRYLVAIYSELKPADALQKRSAQWITENAHP